MNEIKYESGRSMVEMLGTLAIIGVLSIGGIAGYSYGMDKYRANTTMNDVNLRAVDLIAQVNRGSDLSLSEWPEKSTAGYIITLEKGTDGITGGIKISGIEKQVCEMLADDLLPEGVLLTINGEGTAQGKCKEENTLIFYYDAVVGGGQNDDEECNGVMVNDVCTPCPENTTLSSDKTACLCSNGGPVDFDTGECLTPCEEAFYQAFKIGDSTDTITVDGTTAIFNIPADGTPVTATVWSDVNASHCKLKIESGQDIQLDLNSHSVLVDKLSVDGTMTLVDNSDTNMDGTGTGNLVMYNASLSNAVFTMESGKIVNANRFAVSKTAINMSGGFLKSGSIALTDSSTLNMQSGIIEASSMSCSDTDSVMIGGGTFDVSNMSCTNVEDYR
ncbi:MAG: hypothetical protein IKL32_01600 [Alphaproteobacteria bacterium]|nr:hypothetical protein [Alphaproteobacteria bacterium]